MFQTAGLKHQILVIIILLPAFALRVVAIDQIPAGLSHDEAYNGVTAIQTLEGDLQVFYEINKGIEPLIIYLEALAFYFFGIGPTPLRLVNVLAGMLTVALVYPFTARLFNRRVALLAMAGVAVSFWAVFVSRLTLRAVLLPPLLLLTLYLFWCALKPETSNSKLKTRTSNLQPFDFAQDRTPISNLLFFVLSGLAAGLTMYTYLSSRFVPLIILTLVGYRFLQRQLSKWHWLGLLLHLVIWVAIFTPLANYFWQNSESFSRRSGQVTHIPQALEGNFQPILESTLDTLGMFTFAGDTTDRYNLDGRPLFDWVNGLLFYLGFGLVGWRLIRSPGKAGPVVLLLSTTLFMLLPDFITDDSPHFLRTIGALPMIYIFWALGLDWLIHQIYNWRRVKNKTSIINLATRNTQHALRITQHATRHSPFASRTYLLLIILLLTVTTLHTTYDYFIRWANSPNGRYIYGADIAEIAEYLKVNYGENLTVVSAEYYRDLDPFRFKLHFQGHPPFVIWFDGQQTLAFPPADSNLSPRYAFAHSAPPADQWRPFLQPAPEEAGQEYTLYRLAAASPVEALAQRLTPLGTNVNDDLVVLGYQIEGNIESGGKFHVLLGWQALRQQPPESDYTFLITMLDQRGNVWLQVDGNGYTPADWQPGVQALQLLTVRLPADLPPVTYQLTLEVVDRQRGRALPTASGETVIPLEAVTVQLDDKPQSVVLEHLPNLTGVKKARQFNPVGLLLQGYELNSRVLYIGDKLPLTLHWQVDRQPQADYRLQFSLVDESSRLIYRWPPIEPTGGEWPTGQWPTNYWVQNKLTLPLKADIPPENYELHLNWADTSGQTVGETFFELGPLIINGTAGQSP